MQTFPEINTNRLLLNRITLNDQTEVFNVFSNPKVMKLYDMERFTQIQDSIEVIQYFSAKYESQTGIRWAVRDKTTKVYMGSIGLNHINPHEYSASIGYELAPEYWGQGYTQEALKSILDRVFTETWPIKLNRIEALILPHNQASKVVVINSGFKNEGILREKGYWSGQFHNMQVFSLLKSEWTKI